MAYPVTLNGRTYTLADFEGTNYVDGFPDALEDFVTQAGDIYNSTSTSSVTIGTGSKTFTTADSDKPYQAGTPLRIADAAAPETNFLDCIVTSYSGTTLLVDVFGFAGSGTKSSWTINIGGAKTVDGTLAIAQGGTGATTAADAADNLGLGTTDAVTFGSATISGNLAVDTNTLFVDASANAVGIGTANPQYLGHFVDGDVAIVDTDTTNNAEKQSLLFGGASGETATLAAITGYRGSNANFGELVFKTSPGTGVPTEVVRIDSSGNVGVGTSTPGYVLTVRSSSATNLAEIRNIDGGDNHGLTITDGSGVVELAAVYSSSAPDMTFKVGNSERMRIDSSGNLLVGTTSAINSHTIRNTINVPLSVYRDNGNASNSLAIFYSDTGGTQTTHCVIRGDGDLENTNNSYGGLSDARLKSNIVDASPQLDDIMAVKVRSYTLNSTGDKHIGVVAQELEEAGLSGLVKTDEKGMKSVKYSVLYMKAIKAIQEQQAMIEDLKAEVAALKGA